MFYSSCKMSLPYIENMILEIFSCYKPVHP